MNSSFSKSIVFQNFEELIAQIGLSAKDRQVFILTDTTVNELWVSRIVAARPELEKAEILEVEPGEDSKSIEVCNQLWNHLLECNADRNALFINIGGGMVTDLGGFVASTYKRGISFIHVPTSLLGMVDAANGGKTGINHHHIKNCIGSFQLPKQVIIYPGFLATLSKSELKSGFAEMLKHGLICNQSHWNDLISLEELKPDNIQKHIPLSISIKEDIVQKDFFEKGERKLLNLGHTIGHAIESHSIETKNPMTHGEAVALGIICESLIALHLQLINEVDHSIIQSGITKFFNPNNYRIPEFNQIKEYLLNDKKNENGRLLLSLPSAIGSALYNIPVATETINQCYNHAFGFENLSR